MTRSRRGSMPGDREIRQALVEWISETPCDHERRIIHEFWVPLSHERADVAEINGLLSGFEIKSARDHLGRLDRQVQAFDRLFDTITLVADKRHLPSVSAVSPWWGVIEARPSSQGVDFITVRSAAPNPNRDVSVQVRLLWKSELVSILGVLGHEAARGATRASMQQQLLESSSPEVLESVVRAQLLRRDQLSARW